MTPAAGFPWWIAGLAATAFVFAFGLLAILTRALPPATLTAQTSSRSNHAQHARQIGGLGVVPAAIAATLLWGPPWTHGGGPAAILAGAAIAFATGLVDDARDLKPLPKFAGQVLAAAVALSGLAAGSGMPWLLAMAGAICLLVYSINVANFMDGIDLMEVVGLGLPLAFASCALLVAGPTPPPAAYAGLAFAGALAGFAIYNKPPATVFLGDSGSLACGLVAGAVALEAAGRFSSAAAILPFLYFIGDATTTIMLRLTKGENILSAHSYHAYQVAKRAGMPLKTIIGLVAALNAVLCGLAAVAVLAEPALGTPMLGVGLAITFAVIWRMRSASAAHI